jgi:hypothetical protein
VCRLGSCNGVCACSDPIIPSRTIAKEKQTFEIFFTAIAQAVKSLAKGQMIFLQIRLIMLASTLSESDAFNRPPSLHSRKRMKTLPPPFL